MGTSEWNKLSPEEKDFYLDEMLKVPAVVAQSHAGYHTWKKYVAACARSCAPRAYELCKAWAELCEDKFDVKTPFDVTWWSFAKSDGGLSIGTLIQAAQDGGWVARGTSH